VTLDHWAQKLLIDIGCAATVAEKKVAIMLALTAYAEEQAKGYERILLPEGWTVGSIVLFQDDAGERGYEAQAWNFWGEVSAKGPTRAEAVLNAVRHGEKLMALGAPTGKYPQGEWPEVDYETIYTEGTNRVSHFTYQTCDPATGQLVTHRAERLRDIPQEENYRDV
jgi:hypothetical protein